MRIYFAPHVVLCLGLALFAQVAQAQPQTSYNFAYAKHHREADGTPKEAILHLRKLPPQPAANAPLIDLILVIPKGTPRDAQFHENISRYVLQTVKLGSSLVLRDVSGAEKETYIDAHGGVDPDPTVFKLDVRPGRQLSWKENMITSVIRR